MPEKLANEKEAKANEAIRLRCIADTTSLIHILESLPESALENAEVQESLHNVRDFQKLIAEILEDATKQLLEDVEGQNALTLNDPDRSATPERTRRFPLLGLIIAGCNIARFNLVFLCIFSDYGIYVKTAGFLRKCISVCLILLLFLITPN